METRIILSLILIFVLAIPQFSDCVDEKIYLVAINSYGCYLTAGGLLSQNYAIAPYITPDIEHLDVLAGVAVVIKDLVYPGPGVQRSGVVERHHIGDAVSILKLGSPFTFTKTVGKISLLRGNPPNNAKMKLIAWREYNGELGTYRQHVRFSEIIDNKAFNDVNKDRFNEADLRVGHSDLNDGLVFVEGKLFGMITGAGGTQMFKFVKLSDGNIQESINSFTASASCS